MVDPTGFLLTTIRDFPAVAALTTRVRGGEPAPGDSAVPFQRFVVLARLGVQRDKRARVAEVRLVARCYGSTYQDAAALAGAVGDAIHNIGPRTNPSGVLIFRSYDDGGGGAAADPDTHQPYEAVIVSAHVATVPIA